MGMAKTEGNYGKAAYEGKGRITHKGIRTSLTCSRQHKPGDASVTSSLEFHTQLNCHASQEVGGHPRTRTEGVSSLSLLPKEQI